MKKNKMICGNFRVHTSSIILENTGETEYNGINGSLGCKTLHFDEKNVADPDV